MFNIYKYECKHYLTDKMFLILAVITVFYCRFILDSEIILGIADTAPYSPWSFGGYIGMLLPFAFACLLSLFAIACSSDQRMAEQIIDAAPVSHLQRTLRRLGAIYTGFVLLMLLILFIGGWFYLRIFGLITPVQWIAPLVYAVFPALLMVTGIAMQIGRFGTGGIYTLLVVLLLYGLFAGNASLPFYLDLFGSSFFQHYPRIVNGMDPAFSVPSAALFSRLMFSVIGVVFIWLADYRFKKQS